MGTGSSVWGHRGTGGAWLKRRRGSVRVGMVAVAGLLASVLGPVGVPASLPGSVLPFDFNGDGYAELVVGVPGEAIGERQQAGAVNVLRGSPSGPTARGDRMWYQSAWRVAGRSETLDLFGSAVASGDFDRDGFADLVIGVPGEAPSTPIADRPRTRGRAGAVQVIYGSAGGLTTARDRLWFQGFGGVPGDRVTSVGFGSALAVGDFDGDGYADVAIGAPGTVVSGLSGSGQVVILRGSAAGLTAGGAQVWDQTSPGVASEPEDPGENWMGERFGSALAAGDLDADGRSDLAIGVPFDNRALGAVQVLLGSAAGLTATGAQYLIVEVFDPAEPAAREGFGGVLALADFNGDGRADLAAGRPGATLGVTAKSRGRVSVVYTGPGGVLRPETAQDWNLEANFPNTDQALAWFGEALGCGDFTGDGIADLAVGASASGVAGLEQDGAVYLLHGSASGLAETPLVLTQDTPGVRGVQESLDGFGMEQLGAARLSGGSTDWLLVGAPNETLGRKTNAGAVTVVPGSPTGVNPAGSSMWTQARAGVRGIAEPFDRFGVVSG